MSNRKKITHVAIRFNGKIYSLPPPNRHHDIINLIRNETGVETVNAFDAQNEQGFLDEDGNFLRRKAALLSAKLNNQIKAGSEIVQDMLFSENLW